MFLFNKQHPSPQLSPPFCSLVSLSLSPPAIILSVISFGSWSNSVKKELSDPNSGILQGLLEKDRLLWASPTGPAPVLPCPFYDPTFACLVLHFVRDAFLHIFALSLWRSTALNSCDAWVVQQEYRTKFVKISRSCIICIFFCQFVAFILLLKCFARERMHIHGPGNHANSSSLTMPVYLFILLNIAQQGQKPLSSSSQHFSLHSPGP